MRIAFVYCALFVVALAACDSDNGVTPVRDLDRGGTGLDAKVGLEPSGGPTEGGPRLDGTKPVDGVKPMDGPTTSIDGVKPKDGPTTPVDGAKPGDGPTTFPDGLPRSEGPLGQDGPQTVGDGPQAADVPGLFDGPRSEGPRTDGPHADAPRTDLRVTDAFRVGDTTVTRNEAGQYLCTSGAGTHRCACSDGVDNEGDGKVDLLDPCCKHAYDDNEGGLTQCTDCTDNNNNGLVDSEDWGCTGPADNDEATMGTGIPGDNMDPCKQDCFFDGNSGAGDDKCDWNLKCDPNNPGFYLKKSNGDPLCPYDSSYKNCPTTQSAVCLQKCRKITPNGCDCFGCCSITYGSLTKSVLLTSTCQPSLIADPTKCPPCTQVTSCINPCGLCEICVGKPAPDPSCFLKADSGVTITPDGGTPPGACDPGIVYCGGGQSCPGGTWCITGCCIPVDI